MVSQEGSKDPDIESEGEQEKEGEREKEGGGEKEGGSEGEGRLKLVMLVGTLTACRLHKNILCTPPTLAKSLARGQHYYPPPTHTHTHFFSCKI